MEAQPLSKKEIVDLIVAKATNELFTGDRRDGDTPPITTQNFTSEMIRHGAKALRRRLSRQSLSDLVNEALAAIDYAEARTKQLQEYASLAERNERDEQKRALRQRQAELGRKARLQPAILDAARHYRKSKKSAKDAWRAIKQKPYETPHSETVLIQSDGANEIMLVRSRTRTQKRAGIKFGYWQKRYWTTAKGFS